MSRTAYLILENGTVFEGKAFGAEKETTGELVFTTAMTGYLETLTDPSYFGQVVIQTFPLIGNYGVIPADFESDAPSLRGYIVREWCQVPSNFRCEGDLDTFLKNSGIPSYSADVTAQELEEIKNYRVTDAVENTTTDEKKEFKAEDGKLDVVLMDFGAKHNIGRELVKRGCNVTVVPAHTTADEIIAMNPDGIMLSNGPGDPDDNKQIIAELKKLCDRKIPIFGICLGHQLLALSQGAKTEKLKYGHRGANQPAKELATGRVYITSQNHGYAVVSDSVPSNGKVSFVNGNDNTCEGVEYTNMPAFSVQFHPEACGGPQDTAFLFDRFIKLMNDNK